MQVCEFIFTARFARGTEIAENNNFSIAVERTAMEKHSAAKLRKRQKSSILWLRGPNKGILLPEGLSRFAFRRLSEKQKKPKTLRTLRLCGE